MFYSKSTGGFYAPEFRADYEAAGTWPADALEIGAERHAELMAAQAAGMRIQPDADGQPLAVDPPPRPFGPQAEAFLAGVRELRERILNRLSGIHQFSDSADEKAKIGDARDALLALPQHPAVKAAEAAQDIDALEDAVRDEYKRIAGSVPASVKSAFDGMDK